MKSKGFTLARFARGRRVRRERGKAIFRMVFKGGSTLRSLRPLREKMVFHFFSLFQCESAFLFKTPDLYGFSTQLQIICRIFH